MAVELGTEYFADGAEFRRWLSENHELVPGLWLKMAKKTSSHSSIDYDQALDVALCFGWIDSLARRIDDDFFVQKFSRRTARSPWSKRNVEIVARLDAAGLLEPSGIAEIEKAKADGRWDRAYEGSAKAEVPKDFLDALAENPKAREFYATLNSTNRFTIAYRLQEAKRPETRARRIEKFVNQLAEGKKFY
ncbi:hypothetical protein G9U53_00575 [Rhodococcus sp. D-46]|jgi:uncharacterized protein YdeI (YjbR/CyaY-like superfamily)|uniref:YdeI/OmpD-associated family protein n=1 Tax=Rhodococcus TaxID=1827 RepID=UPI0007E59EE6|nr:MULTISPECIES: YdeI/OmpD-associated family protein [Rhodococcus]NHE62808.1 hypothetical protein [Rhodococcus sp. D-46]ARE33591.1 hypothetical protein A0W34_09750 [Rhodococcus sp. BH4]MBT2274399.1 YdeI/OmpD-associated family protein [Rhodococcus qingshengii]UXF69298.1 YdeI/OmpD-associated family protein [Rhodococcus qingshengii]WCT04561.1 YdeI/OmpD-associated family protein [Rhodococcus qingshengii]